MMCNDNGQNKIQRVRQIDSAKLDYQRHGNLPIRLIDVARMMEESLPEGCSTDGIHFDRPKGPEWLNQVFQRHMDKLESDLILLKRFNSSPPHEPPFFPVRHIDFRLGE